jgi:hypothetical protein
MESGNCNEVWDYFRQMVNQEISGSPWMWVVEEY